MNLQRRYFVVLLAITLLGGALRGFRLGSNSLWVDEVVTAQSVQGGLLDVTQAALTNNNIAPFYFWAVHIILWLTEESEVSLRLLSALSGTLMIPLFYCLMKRFGADGSCSLASALMLAIHPLHIWFSQEARPYALLLFLATSALLALVGAFQNGRLRHWILAGILLYMTFLTHLVGLAVLAIAWCWALLLHRTRATMGRLAALSLILALLCAPWLIALARRPEASHAPARGLTFFEIPYTLLTFVGGYSLGPGPRHIQNLGAANALRAHLPQSLLIFGVLGILAVLIPRARSRSAAYLWVVFLVPMLLLLLGSAVSDFPFNIRYVLLGLVGFLGLTTLSLRTISLVPRTICLMALLGSFLLADVQWYSQPDYRKEDSRAVVEWLRAHAGSRGPIAVAPSYMTTPLQYYAGKLRFDAVFVPVQDIADLLSVKAVAGLAVSREHHVAKPRELESAFAVAAGGRVALGVAPGFRLSAREQSLPLPQLPP